MSLGKLTVVTCRSDFVTESESGYERQAQESIDKTETDSTEDVEARAKLMKEMINTSSCNVATSVANEERISKKPRVDEGTHAKPTGKEAIAHDLAQMYTLGDKYQLPALKDCVLDKLTRLVNGYPLQFLRLITILDSHISDSDDQFWAFVQGGLEQVAADAGDTRDEIVDSIIECGYLRHSGALAEAILKAFGSCKKRHCNGWCRQ